ncbi:hypothetical protein [Blastomonas aquatica]|uniref:hypothetical protein n=1 Tax=Blastomonas aquatica TaxID=1510276 RepID=UPI00166A9AFB|nr:hypothetical protein [Blastomonas aquatica]
MKHSIVAPAILAALCMAGPAPGQSLKRPDAPFIRSADGKLVGRLDGPACSSTVSLVFSGTSEVFGDGKSANRMMSNVVQNVRASCGSVNLIAAKGVANGRVVYNAVADASSKWLLLELGGDRSGGLLASGTVGASGDQNRFAASNRFLPLGSLLKTMGGARYLCAQQTAEGCTVSTEFRAASEGGATLVSRYLLDGGGTLATVSYDGTNVGGLLCANPKSAKITVEGGSQSPAARARLADDLRERLDPYGSQICSGWQASGPRFIGANFNAQGAQLGKALVLTTSATPPKLRREE